MRCDWPSVLLDKVLYRKAEVIYDMLYEEDDMLSDMPYGNTSTLSAMLNWQAEQIDEV